MIGAAGGTPATAPPIVADDHSIAVLPFVNMSSDKEQDYFSDGLSEELLNLLAQVPQLRVIARTSSFSFKGKDADVATVARALNVGNVLEGSVRKSGDTLRITAQLVRASDSSHLWSQTYDRKMTDVFKVQDDIAGAVVAALKVRLLPAQQITNPRRTGNTEAYSAYLLGNQFYNRGNIDGFNRAVAAYRRAVTLDPEICGGLCRIGDCRGPCRRSTRPRPLKSRPGRCARGRRGKGPSHWHPTWPTATRRAAGYAPCSFTNGPWGRRTSSKARLLDPGNCTVQHYYARLMGSFGRLEEAIAAHKKATELDPLSAWAWNHLGREYSSNGQFQEAREALNRALTVSPEFTAANYNLGNLELLEGRAPRGTVAVPASRRDGGAMPARRWPSTAWVIARESQRALDELIAKNAHDAGYQVAQVYAWRGEQDNAFEWLERAYVARDGGLNRIKIDPLLASLRADPRFAAMVKKIGLPP